MNNRNRCYAALVLGLLGAASASAQPDVEAQAEAVRELSRAREEAARAQAESVREYERAQQEARRTQADSMRQYAQARQEAQKAQAESALELARAREQLEEAARQLALLSGQRGNRTGGTRGQYGLYVYSGGRAMLGLNLDLEPTELGVRVVGVTPGGPAADAGVVVGDVLAAIDGTDLTGLGPPSPTDRLLEQTRDLSPGRTLALRVLRDGDYHDLTVQTRESAPWALRSPNVTMVPMPALPSMPSMPSVPSYTGFRLSPFGVAPWADLELVPLTPGLGEYFGVDKGLLVVRAAADGPFGFRDGDVIIDISGREPLGPEHALRILSSFEPGETMRVTIMRQRRRETLEVKMPDANTPA